MALCRSSLRALLSSVLLVAMASCGSETPVSVISTELGEIIGLEESVSLPDGTQRQTLNVFRGVPYARPPVGQLRFSKPQPAPKFSRPFQAFQFGPACPQSRPVAGNTSEDCLSLNIYAPKLLPTAAAQNVSLPVMVWIHGGAFVSGEARQVPGKNLASFGNIVVVTMNFRVGALGFLATDDAAAPGNWGLWDQRLALRWVSDNIRGFGGDPDRVTLAGTTSGAFCVTFHALFPHSSTNDDVNEDAGPLFHRILVESGTALSVGGYHKRGLQYAEALAGSLGCGGGGGVTVTDSSGPASSRSESIIACLREKDADGIAGASVRPDRAFTLTWAPVVDGDFIAKDPSTVVSWPPFAGSPSSSSSSSSSLLASLGSVDAMIGTTSEDGSIMLQIWVASVAAAMNESAVSGVSPALLGKSVELLLASSRLLGPEASAEVSRAVRRALLQEYTDWDKPTDSASRGRRLVQLLTGR